MTPPSLHDTLAALLHDAGREALDRFLTVDSERKGDGSHVTEADRVAEQVLVRGLTSSFPGEAIVGEEGARVGAGNRVWYVDPIDGTSAFLEGLAHWGPMVGRAVDGQPQCGAIYFPRLREFWFAERGHGAWRDGQRLAPLVPRGLDKEQVVLVPGRFHTLARLTVPCKLRNLGSIASHLSLVAAGGATATLVGPGWSPWDVVAGMVLLEEVGGVALSLDGKPLDPVTGRPEPFVAGAAPACESVLASLRPQHPQRA